jgi:hypothetical protein
MRKERTRQPQTRKEGERRVLPVEDEKMAPKHIPSISAGLIRLSLQVVRSEDYEYNE